MIAVDAAGAVYAIGTFLGSADLDPGSGVSTLASAGAADVFVMKQEAAPSGILLYDAGVSFFSLYPNPASDRIWISTFSGKISSVEIFNVTGEKVIATDNSIDNSIDISFLRGEFI